MFIRTGRVFSGQFRNLYFMIIIHHGCHNKKDIGKTLETYSAQSYYYRLIKLLIVYTIPF